MAKHHQLNLPPTSVERLGTPAGDANSVGIVDLVTVVVAASGRLGFIDKEMAAIFGLNESDYSKAFSLKDATRNKPMKVKLPKRIAREICAVLAEACGLVVLGDEDAKQIAAIELMTSAAKFLRLHAAGGGR